MKERLSVGLFTGFLTGALGGLIESFILLRHTSFWRLEIPTVFAAMGIYGGLFAFLSFLWTLFAKKLPLTLFVRRSFLFGIISVIYFFVGFYANYYCFPEINDKTSLVFDLVWTLAWLVLSVRLLHVRVQGSVERAQKKTPLFLNWLLTFSLILQTPAVFAEAAVARKKPNVLLVVLDTTRADHLSLYGYGRKTTPFLEVFAEECLVFDNASSTAPWTLPSHASLFTGLYPSQHQTDWSHPYADGKLMTLAEILKEKGYQTAAISNNAWIGRGTNLDQGFDYFEQPWLSSRLIHRLAVTRAAARIVKLISKGHHEDAGAKVTNQDFRSWFDQAYDPSKPFFWFVNYVEPHFLYAPPEPYRSRFLNPENIEEAEGVNAESLQDWGPGVRMDARTLSALTDLYDGEIAYLDMRLQELIDELKTRHLLDDTIVIIVSDHGESIGDHDLFEHQFSIYENLLHVPLLIRYPPGIAQPKHVPDPVSLVEIVPTLLRTLEIRVPEWEPYWTGRDLLGSVLATTAPYPILAEYEPPPARKRKEKLSPEFEKMQHRYLRSLKMDGVKYIWASDGQHELYDMPGDELKNLIGAMPDKARTLDAALQGELMSLKKVEISREERRADPATLQKLRSLGYIQ